MSSLTVAKGLPKLTDLAVEIAAEFGNETDPTGVGPFLAATVGQSDNTFASLAAFRAASTTTFRTATLAVPGGLTGPFYFETANAPYVEDGVNTIKADDTSLSTGAWVRQGADKVAYDTAKTVGGKLDEVYSVLDARFAGGAKPDNPMIDDAPAFQAAFNLLKLFGGHLEIPRGRYLFNSTVLIDRRYAVPGGDFLNGERTLKVSGYGAEITTSGAIAAFEIRGGWAPNQSCVIEGLLINHRTNTTATHGIRLIGASLTTLRDIVVVVNGGLPDNYAAFQLENEIPSDVDTGCFWNLIERCGVRPWSGSDGNCDFGIRLIGTANATVISQCILGGSNTHIHVGPHAGQPQTANAIVIDRNCFEGPNTATGIDLVGADTVYHVTGARITNCRFEAINTAVSLSGIGETVQLPTFMAGNYADTSVPNYLVNPLNIPMVVLDGAIVGAGMPPFTLRNQRGLIVQNDDAGFDAVAVRASSNGRGYTLSRGNGLLLGSWRQRPSLGSTLSGNDLDHPLFMSAVGGISGTAVECQNVGGARTLASGASNVTFPGYLTEVDANYRIQLTGNAAEHFYVTAKSTTGFTINSSNAASTAVVDWFMYRA